MNAQVLFLTVNGSPVQVLYEGTETLLEILRDKLDLTGAKEGCGYGACGTCTVIVNGKAEMACLVKGKARLEGAQVLTIEGLARGDQLHPVQRAFIDAGAIQCGFCTPGFVMRLHALYTARPHATDDEIRAALQKHLCRCTGYESIWEAAVLARTYMEDATSAASPPEP